MGFVHVMYRGLIEGYEKKQSSASVGRLWVGTSVCIFTDIEVRYM